MTDINLISLFHESVKDDKDSLLSDSTYEDLNMDDFFRSVDFTSSCIGQQVLYHILHYNNQSEIFKQEEFIEKLSRNNELHIKLCALLKKLRHSDAYYIASLFVKPIPVASKRSLRILSVCRFIPFVFCALMLMLHSATFLILLVTSLVLNTFLHYREKSNIQEYCFSIPQLIKMIQQAEKINGIDDFKEVCKNIQPALSRLRVLKKKLIAFKLSIRLESDYALLVYLITELFNIFFLNEAYSINKAFISLIYEQKTIRQVFDFIGNLDVMSSVALLREQLPYYSLPQKCSSGNRLYAESIYHPLVKDAISNDFILTEKSVLLTGSNMSGKTTFIRTIGINLLSSKVLNTCFAKSFCIPFDIKLYSAIHTADDLMEGKSYFLSEVNRIKDLLHAGCCGRSMFLIDELFKGTNTRERIAIGKAVLSALAKNDNIVFVSTHDIELAQLLEQEYDLYYFNESVTNNTLTFDYKIKKGVATERNAIKILEMFDYPDDVIKDAYQNAQ